LKPKNWRQSPFHPQNCEDTHLINILVKIDYPDTKHIILTVSYFLEIGYTVYIFENQKEYLYIVGFRHMELFVERKHSLLSNVHVFKALGDETRQNMIKLLSKKEWYGEELAKHMELSNSTVSYHLSILLLEGIVLVNRVDNKSFFKLDKENLNKIITQAYKRMVNH